jgi:hypothetical protein
MAAKTMRVYVEKDGDSYTVIKTTNTTMPFVGMPLGEQEVNDLCVNPQYEVTITAAKEAKEQKAQ